MKLSECVQWTVRPIVITGKDGPQLEFFLLYGLVELPGFVHGDGETVPTTAPIDEWLLKAAIVADRIGGEYQKRQRTFTQLEPEYFMRVE